MKTIKIFLASSNELGHERKEISSLIRQENDRLIDNNLYFKLIVWEELLHSFRDEKIQNYFNEEMLKCDIVIILFYKKIGQFTKEEFDLAYKNLKSDKKPQFLFVFFKETQIPISEIDDEMLEVKKLRKTIESYQQIYNTFTHVDSLIHIIKRQLDLVTQEFTTGEISIPKKPSFYAYDQDWVGRENCVKNMVKTLNESTRILLILGLTGVGKTALAECLALSLENWFHNDWQSNFIRANFDYDEKPIGFETVATRWLEEWGIEIKPEERRPEKLLEIILKRVLSNRTLIIIDSFERLIENNEYGEEADTINDPWWEKFLLLFLSAETCESKIIITSQDLPSSLSGSRYTNFLAKNVLYGLSDEEQLLLFEKVGFDISSSSTYSNVLKRIGKAYEGHPLALRVIIGEIKGEPFNGNVNVYWNEVKNKIEDVEKAIAEAQDNNKHMGNDDWQLHKLTRSVREQINRQRLEIAFHRLKTQAKDSYIMICCSSVYRTPVQINAWQMQLIVLIKRIEGNECDTPRAEAALDELRRRFLIKETLEDEKRLIGLHNLVRSVALSELNCFFETL
jgi:hypothetical protein